MIAVMGIRAPQMSDMLKLYTTTSLPTTVTLVRDYVYSTNTNNNRLVLAKDICSRLET